MSPEQHLAAILSAWKGFPGYGITRELDEALAAAERDFDGVEEINMHGKDFLGGLYGPELEELAGYPSLATKMRMRELNEARRASS